VVAGKVAVVIQKGMIRPVSSFVAAKFAAECHNEVKNHVTVRSHWKKYKGDSRLLSDYYHSLLPQSFGKSILDVLPLFNILYNAVDSEISILMHVLPCH
jgi:hypothetical protein